MPKTVPSVAIINSSEDTIEVLRLAFEKEGFAVASTHVSSVKSGETDLLAWVGEHSPDVIVYDIALPYEENFTFLRLLRTSDALKEVQWVITTTHKQRLEELVGNCGEVYEVVGKPYDLQQIVDAVARALGPSQPS
jgi:CheY-like chemotaxis protein